MTEQEFLTKMTETIDTEQELTMDTVLSSVEEWDSLAVVSTIALGSTAFSRKMTAKEVLKAETVRDLYKLLVE